MSVIGFFLGRLLSLPLSPSLAMTTTPDSYFVKDEVYVKFVVSHITNSYTQSLSSTTVSWVPERLLVAEPELWALVQADKLLKRDLGEGLIFKSWVEPLWAFEEKHPELCVSYGGANLNKVSGNTVRVSREFYSCTDF